MLEQHFLWVNFQHFLAMKLKIKYHDYEKTLKFQQFSNMSLKIKYHISEKP